MRFQDKVYQTIHRSLELLGEKKCLERVWKGTHVYMYFKTYIQYSVARDFTDQFGNSPLHIARQEFFPGGYGTAFIRGFPYFRRFDLYFQHLVESGLILKWTADMHKDANKQPHMVKVTGLEESVKSYIAGGPIAFSVRHLTAAFYMTLIMFSVSFFIFIAEIFFYFQSPKTVN